MNCYVLCKECGEKVKRQYKKDLPCEGTGEHVEIVSGKLIQDTKCDGCPDEKIISAGEQAYAVTSWSDNDKKPYIPWEHEFIEKEEAKVNKRSICHDCDNKENFPVCLGSIRMKIDGEPDINNVFECVNFHPALEEELYAE